MPTHKGGMGSVGVYAYMVYPFPHENFQEDFKNCYLKKKFRDVFNSAEII